MSLVTADKGYDSEDNHVLVRDMLYAFSVIPPRYEDTQKLQKTNEAWVFQIVVWPTK